MNVWGVVWAGTPTEAREHASTFLRRIGAVEPDSDDLVILGPEHRNHDHHTLLRVPELLVDDVHSSIALLPGSVTVMGVPVVDRDGAWVHVTVDGELYGLTSGCSACACKASCPTT
jgi:hypothetical protein